MSTQTTTKTFPLPPEADVAATVDDAITSRRSIRAFLPTPVPRDMVEHLLRVASRAPSGTNMQPWRVYVVAGAKKDALCKAILEDYEARPGAEKREWKYYPDEFFEPYLSRRRSIGWGLYGLLGIKKGEKERMKEQRGRNYVFFDAPVGLIFTIDRRLELGSWLDYGMFLQNLMVSARSHGLHTCPQAAFGDYYRIIRTELGVPESEIVICGMSVGYANPDAVVNQLQTERAPVEDFTTFFDL